MNKNIRQLQSVDWNFLQKSQGVTQKLHWYPGTFPSDMPATLIEGLSEPNNIVWDSFAGVGTTSNEALRLGRKAWITENNPVALLIAYIQGSLIILKSLNNEYIDIVIDDLQSCCSENNEYPLFPASNFKIDFSTILSSYVQPTPEVMFEEYVNNNIPKWSQLTPWIEPETLNDLKLLWEKLITSDIDLFIKLVGILMISAILRPASSQIKSWGHLSDNVYPKEFEKKSISSLCTKWMKRTNRILSKTAVKTATPDDKTTRFWVSSHNWSIETKPINIPNNKIDLLITSPPYANAIDYIRCQRLSLSIFGYTNKQIDQMGNDEIGARRKRSKKTSKEQWANELQMAIEQQLKFIDKQGVAAFVLPHKDSGREIGYEKISELFKNGWVKSLHIDRSIDQNKTTQSWTSIKKETIVVYSKQE